MLECCDQPVCLSVCLSIHKHISRTAGPTFRKFGVHIPCGSGSVLLWLSCATYVLPVLWIMSCLAIMGSMVWHGGLIY